MRIPLTSGKLIHPLQDVRKEKGPRVEAPVSRRTVR